MKNPLLTLFFGFIVSQTAYSTQLTGNVVDLRVTGTVKANTIVTAATHVELSGSRGRPDCANSDSGKYWAVDTDTPEGKNILSVLLAAKLASKEVTVWGSGTCIGAMESIVQVGIQ